MPAERNVQHDESRARSPLAGDPADSEGTVFVPTLTRRRGELASGDSNFAELALLPTTLSPDTDLDDAVDQFQAERQESPLAIVNGAVVGTVTDPSETVVGDIEAPIDVAYATTDGTLTRSFP